MPRKKASAEALARPLGPTFILQWRLFRDLSQEVVAAQVEEVMGMSFTTSTLSRIETGDGPYNQRQIEALAVVLRCTVAELISRDPTAAEYEWSIGDLPKGDRDQVENFIRALRLKREYEEGEGAKASELAKPISGQRRRRTTSRSKSAS